MITTQHILSVREITAADIDLITNYWLNAGDDFLSGMGVDLSKMPSREEWRSMLAEQINLPYREKKSYCIIWEINKIPVGHSNINNVKFGEEAFMHLHLWANSTRKKGVGTELVNMTIPYFFRNFDLKILYCEPYALNTAPNKTLEKTGFEFVKEYITTPGWLNFEQKVKLWRMTRENFLSQWG